MSKIIDFQKYKNKKNNTYENSVKEDVLTNEAIEMCNYLELWDRFYDYFGQRVYDYVSSGKEITKEWLDSYGFESKQQVQNYLDNWRGNSEEEFQKWLKENEYEL